MLHLKLNLEGRKKHGLEARRVGITQGTVLLPRLKSRYLYLHIF